MGGKQTERAVMANVSCPCVGNQVFVPKDRQDSPLYAIPGQRVTVMLLGHDRVHREWRQQYVTIAWIKDYARRVGQAVEWREVALYQ